MWLLSLGFPSSHSIGETNTVIKKFFSWFMFLPSFCYPSFSHIALTIGERAQNLKCKVLSLYPNSTYRLCNLSLSFFSYKMRTKDLPPRIVNIELE